MLCGGLTSVLLVHFFSLGYVMPIEEYICVFTVSAYFSTMSVLGGLCVFCVCFFIFYLTVLVYIFPVRCVLLLQAPQLLMSEPNSVALMVFNLNK